MSASTSDLLLLQNALPAEITVFSGEAVLAHTRLGPGKHTIGRDASCDVVVNVEGVSRRHATLSIHEGSIQIEDLGSTNGTFMDGQRLAGAAVLPEDGQITLGSVARMRIEHHATISPAPDEERTATPEKDEALADPPPSSDEKEAVTTEENAEAEQDLEIFKQQLAEALRARDDARSQLAEMEKLRGKVIFLTEAREILLQQLSVAAQRLHAPDQCSPEEAKYLRREVNELEGCLTRALEQQRQLEERYQALSREARQRSAVQPAASTVKSRRGVRALGMGAAATVIVATVLFAFYAARQANERARQAEDVVARTQPFAQQFRDDAAVSLERGMPIEALARISCAIALRPAVAEYHIIQGHVCESLLRIPEAHAAYTRALEIDPRNVEAQENQVVCQRILATRQTVPSEASLYGLHRVMMKQRRFAQARAMAGRLPDNRELLRETWQAIMDHARLGAAVTLAEDGMFELNLSSSPSSDLTALTGMPLAALNVSQSGVTDLAPLAGLPLRALDISRTRVRDLSPLRGMRLKRVNLAETPVIHLDPLAGLALEELDIAGTNVSDLSPLSGMPLRLLRMAGAPIREIAALASVPLRELDASRTRVSDISALRSLPLESLRLDHTEVRDLSPLAGAPVRNLSIAHTRVSDLGPLRNSGLKELDLSGCTGIESLEALTSCTALERLVIPRHCRDFQLLKTLPSLRFLSFEGDGKGVYDRTAAEFWREQDELAQQDESVNGRPRSSLPPDNPSPFPQ